VAKLEKIVMGPLDALHIRTEKSSKTIVLLHGYGANMEDLVGLASTCPSANWIFPNAPVDLGQVWGMDSRTWFSMSFEGLEKATREATYREFFDQHRGVFEEAQEKLRSAVMSLSIPASEIVLGGFSQGALMASDFFLRSSEDFHSLIILSGMFPDNIGWEECIQKKSPRPVFQSHGREDPLLAFSPAETLAASFLAKNWPVTWVPFRGGHQIPDLVLQELSKFLNT
jgi:phospholipase/carboxylesterase